MTNFNVGQDGHSNEEHWSKLGDFPESEAFSAMSQRILDQRYAETVEALNTPAPLPVNDPGLDPERIIGSAGPNRVVRALRRIFHPEAPLLDPVDTSVFPTGPKWG